MVQTQSAGGGAAPVTTQDALFRLAGTLGKGPGALQFSGEQTSNLTPDVGLLRQSKYDVAGALGAGDTRLNLHVGYTERHGDTTEGPLEQAASLHLDRALSSKVKLIVDSAQNTLGTVGEHADNGRSTVGLTASLGPQTKVTAAFSSYLDQGSDPSQPVVQTAPQASTSRDLLLEQRLGALQFRAEGCQIEGAAAGTETGWGVDWTHGKLPEWATSVTRRHEFGDIYDYKVAREESWLDLPFAGTRFWMKERAGGLDAGANTYLLSHRMLLSKRCHLQLTLHERPEYEDGVDRGRPQPLRREYLELGTPFTSGLLGRVWVSEETGLLDSLNQRQTLGLNLCGKLTSRSQTEFSLSHTTGFWDQISVNADTVAVFYNLKVSDDHKVTVKVGYTWGDDPSVVPGCVDYRATIAYSKPV